MMIAVKDKKMDHLINRLLFEMNCPDEDEAFRIRHNFAGIYQEQIRDIVDRICSKYTQEDEWIRIDRLEVDLGQINPAVFDSYLPEIFLNKFEKELTLRLSEIPDSERRNSRADSYAGLLQYFLLHGTLPWWANGTSINIGMISRQVIEGQLGGFRQFLENNKWNVRLWQRISYQLPATVKDTILSQFEDLDYAGRQFSAWIAVLYPGNMAGDTIEGTVRQKMTDVLLENAPLIIGNKDFKNEIKRIFAGNIPRFADRQIPDIAVVFQPGETAPVPGRITGENPQMHFPEPQPETSVPESYFIQHAGIMILAPFLQSFYDELGLLKGSLWKNDESRHRAAHLLKFMATGTENLPEYDFVLEKLICGIPVEGPLPLDSMLSDRETGEVRLLLESVIQYWTALKNTSVNGLRETFLKREGIVSRKEDGWLVQIERKTWDVLLDKMPWGYSTIALPWNDYIIHTEW
jgi:hypothetical protein